MPTTIYKLLENNDLTIHDIAARSGVAEFVLKNAVKKPLEDWSIRELSAFATGLGMQAPELLSELQSNDYKLEINDASQVIQGVLISSKELYQQTKFAVVSTHLEGWEPTKEDIQFLLKEVQTVDSEFNETYEELFEK